MEDFVPEDYRKDEEWKNRLAYWMAAIGSAVGLGNIWRFPWRVYQNGGGSFLVAYFTVLFLLGMPMLTQEMALGQYFHGGDVEAYGRIHGRFRGIGLASVVGVFVIATYYSVVISWSLVYAISSLQSPQPWAYDGTWGDYDDCISVIYYNDSNVTSVIPNCTLSDGSTGDCPTTYAECLNSAAAFFDEMTMQAADVYSGKGNFSSRVFGATVAVWICVYISVIKGVKSVSYVVYVTVPVPCLFLAVLLIKALTLDGSGQGVSDYLTTDLSTLADAQLWLDAITQCFFSLSVCIGVMTAYSSFTRTGSVALDEKVVAFADVSIAFVSGFCIYGVLGHLNKSSRELGDDIDYREYGGGGLVFIALPTALLTFEQSGFFSALFFFMLFLLGIDSAFAMIEACTTVVCDSDLSVKFGWTKKWVSLVLSIIGFLLSIPYCTDVGPFHIDIVDNYVNSFGMTFVGMMETFALGWVFGYTDQVKIVGDRAVKLWNYGYWSVLVFSTFFSFCLAFPRYELDDEDGSKVLLDFNGGVGNKAVWIGFTLCVIGWSTSIFLALRSARAHNPEISTNEALWGIMGWLGAEIIREHVNSGGGKGAWKTSPEEERRIWMRCDCGKLSIVWGWLIKYFIPGFLFVLLCDLLRKEQYNPFMGLKVGGAYQIEGLFPFFLMLICVFGVMVYPQCMEQEYDHKANTKDTEMMNTKDLDNDNIEL